MIGENGGGSVDEEGRGGCSGRGEEVIYGGDREIGWCDG